MKRQVICTVSNDLNYDQRMIRICSALSENGFDVLLVGRELRTSKSLQKRSFRQKRWRCWFVRGPLFYLEHNLRIFLLLLFKRHAIIYSVDLDTVPGAALAGLFRRRFWIYDAHEYFTEVPELENRPNVKRVWALVERYILRRADYILTVSESIANVFRKSAKSHVLVIRNVPLLRSIPENRKKKSMKTLIYQGALNEGRCVEAYIQSMLYLDAELWLAGEGDLSSELRKLSQTTGVSHKVHFLGRLEPEELWSYTLQADIGLNVLERKGESYYYSLSNKCFDYMQAGIPQLCSGFPEYEKLNEQWNCMILCEPAPDDITGKIKWLLNDSELYSELAKNAELASRELNWEVEKLKLSSLYESIG